MKSPRVILFDIDDTLCATTEFARKARLAAVRAMIEAGLDVPEEVVLGELDEILTEFTSNYDHHFDRLLQRLRPKGVPEGNPGLIVAAGVTAYHDTKFHELRPFPDVVPLLRDLRTADVGTGIVTHGWTLKQAEKLVRLGLVPYLDRRKIFISDQVGFSKPNPKLYRAALQAMELPAAEVMYVGDSLLHDVAPPKEIGMIAVWAKRAARKGYESCDVRPDHEIDSFDDLRTLLREHYGLPLPS